ncbi:MAG: helix-turn-helix domain-containing protein [Bacteroides sp.]|nr:helix-turn-helix domain-containing protein [Bacteroides sp.]
MARLIIVVIILGVIGFQTTPATKSHTSHNNMIERCQSAITDTDYATALQLGDSLQLIGKNKNDDRLLAYGMGLSATAAILAGKGTNADTMLNNAYNLSETLHNDSLRAISINALGIYEAIINANYYVAHRYFLNALEAAETSGYELMRIRCLNNLTELGLHENDSTFIRYAKEAYERAKRFGAPKPLYVATLHLASAYLNNFNDLEKAERYIEESERISNATQGDKTPLKVMKASLLSKSHHPYEALALLEEAENSFTKSSEQASALPEIYYVRAEAWYNLGNYANGIAAAQHCITLAKQLHVEPLYIKALKLLGECYEKTGNYSDAVEIMKKYMTLHDSLFNAQKEHTVRELDIIYNVGKLEQEAAEREARYKLVTQKAWLLGLSVFLLGLIILGLIYVIKRKSQLYTRLVAQHQKLVEEENKLRYSLNPDLPTIFEEIKSNNEYSGAPLAPEIHKETTDVKAEEESMTDASMVCANAEKIWLDLCKIMDTEKIYATPDISRETVARKINTNRTYLTKIISFKTGMTYPQFINHYRLNEAILILSDKNRNDYPIKMLASDLGFSSLSTFYTVFKARTGLTPKDFRANAK